MVVLRARAADLARGRGRFAVVIICGGAARRAAAIAVFTRVDRGEGALRGALRGAASERVAGAGVLIIARGRTVAITALPFFDGAVAAALWVGAIVIGVKVAARGAAAIAGAAGGDGRVAALGLAGVRAEDRVFGAGVLIVAGGGAVAIAALPFFDGAVAADRIDGALLGAAP